MIVLQGEVGPFQSLLLNGSKRNSLLRLTLAGSVGTQWSDLRTNLKMSSNKAEET